MSQHSSRALSAAFALTTSLLLAVPAVAQINPSPPIHFRVSGPAQRLEMIVGTSRILTLDHRVPRLVVNNEQVLRANPLSPNQIQVFATAPGITQLNLWDEDNKIRAVDVIVIADSRELQNLIGAEFPEADVRVRPSNGTAQGSVILSGFVPRADWVPRIESVARDFYPNVINNMQVGGVQTVLLHVKVFEVSRTKLRQMGVDWATILGTDFIIQSASGLINGAATQAGAIAGAGDSVRFGVLDGGNTFGALINLLRQNNMAKLLAEPTLVTVSGRPASFNSGGEVPVPVSAGLGVTTVEYREFGTQVDFVPIVLGNGNIRLEVRPQITEIAADLRDPVTQTPGFRSRRVDTGVEMRAGQTLALAGLIQSRVEASSQGLPWLMDLPWLGGAFRTVREQVNEIELLIMVTPEFVAPLEPYEVSPYGPGQNTASPTDIELYGKAYLEVPNLGPAQTTQFPSSGGSMMTAPGAGFPPGAVETLPPATRQPLIPTPADGARRSGPTNGGRYVGGGPVPTRPAPDRGLVYPQNRGNAQNVSNSRQPYPPVVVEQQPQLIGPVGYDELK